MSSAALDDNEPDAVSLDDSIFVQEPSPSDTGGDGGGHEADGGATPEDECSSHTQDSHSTASRKLKLYDGAQISQEIGLMLLLNPATRHKLTSAAFSDVVKVLSLHLPVGCAPSSYASVYKLIRAVATSQALGNAKMVHHLCGK